ncbi:WYL domain-containing protein [Streptomyces sp. NBC_00057]
MTGLSAGEAEALWYVVAGPGPRTYRVDQILRLTVLDEKFAPPENFDLAGHWERHQADFHARLHQAEALVRIAPHATSHLMGAAARALADSATPDPDGWIRAVLPIESLDHAHGVFLALGENVEVLGPPELRAAVAATVRALAMRYASG